MSDRKMRLGIAGLGTVGVGVVKMVQQHGALYASRSGGVDIEISAVRHAPKIYIVT